MDYMFNGDDNMKLYISKKDSEAKVYNRESGVFEAPPALPEGISVCELDKNYQSSGEDNYYVFISDTYSKMPFYVMHSYREGVVTRGKTLANCVKNFHNKVGA